MSWIDYVILAVVAVCFALAVYFSLRKSKKGCCSGCSGCCSGCPHSAGCGDKSKSSD